jgi:hypothetical protein
MNHLVPFIPETLLDMQRRYPQAIADPFEVDHLRLGTQSPVGSSRRNVFDFQDGLRLVISHEIEPCSCEILAIGCYIEPDSEWIKAMTRVDNPVDLETTWTEFVERFRLIACEPRPFTIPLHGPIFRQGRMEFDRELKRCRAKSGLDAEDEEIVFTMTGGRP